MIANLLAIAASEGKVFTDSARLPSSRVALVFGCNPFVEERPNLYFDYRIEKALDAWKTGKVKGFVVSGDNSRKDYDEPQAMLDALVKGGVPEEIIVCDYAGLRTLDSVVRAKEVFGLDKLLFISQRFQNERALYIAEYHGIDAISLSARDVAVNAGLKTKLREFLARPKMLLDLHILGGKPRFLGDKEPVPFAFR
ncbi:SanA/YdcF family protein [Rubritalea sp.]|uniref:SanA/YdcF family protein n=1 Tax=Rubritalea sp. TaxID=2109375 RepID=UPI003EF94F19